MTEAFDHSIALTSEALIVDKREVETGKVTVRTVVDESPLTLRDALTRHAVSVEHIAIDRPINVAPEIRTEGDVTIIPVVAERVELVRKLYLVEEFHVRRSATVEPVEISTTRRSMRAVVERTSDQSLNEQVENHG